MRLRFLVPIVFCAASLLACGEPGPQELSIDHQVVGTGVQPGPRSHVQVHYHGTLEDGTVFDSTRERGRPASFSLGRVVPCWRDGIPLMKVGGKATLTCPPETAYGDRQTGKIPPNSTLTFEVELLGVR